MNFNVNDLLNYDTETEMLTSRYNLFLLIEKKTARKAGVIIARYAKNYAYIVVKFEPDEKNTCNSPIYFSRKRRYYLPRKNALDLTMNEFFRVNREAIENNGVKIYPYSTWEEIFIYNGFSVIPVK